MLKVMGTLGWSGWMLALCLGAATAGAAKDPKTAIVAADRVQPKGLAALLAAKTPKAKPGLLHIGFQELYRQGHIPASIFAGPGTTAAGLKLLESKVKGLSRDKALVLYCGCCPWGDCPNVLPAYQLLKKMGFKNLKVLEIKENFGADWAAKGYPETQGE